MGLVAEMVRELEQVLSAYRSFPLWLRTLRRFEGPPAVLYAAPEPAAPFVALTETLSRRFGFVPYDGAHADIVPHLTIATSEDGEVLDLIQADLRRVLPIHAAVDRAEVWERLDDGWRMLRRFLLARD